MFLFRKKAYHYSESLSNIAWRRFKKNRLALFSLIFILIVLIIAIVGYWIIPDSSPMANQQYLELATKKPGFSVLMLQIKKDNHSEKRNFVEKMLFGQPNLYQHIPIEEYTFEGENILVKRYNTAEWIKFNNINILFPEIKEDKIFLERDVLFFCDKQGIWHRELLVDLQKKVVKDHIVLKRFPLGTDRFGRDVLSQLVIGTRVSLSVGFIAVVISLLVGVVLGSLAGFFRGRVDDFIVWLINVVWSIPTLLLVIAIAFALGKGFWQVFIAVGLTMWVEVARVVRGQIISLREREFVEAGRALGFSNARLIIHHILPNVVSAVIVISAANFASAILLEAGLSFLGVGVQPPMPSWGMMIKENYGYIILDSAYLAILPGVAIMVMVLAFMLVGNGLRDALDVKEA